MPQTSLAEYVGALDKAGLLTRHADEKRVDELPALMEANPDTAILVERVRDCEFPFFANGYGVRPMYALSLDCGETKVGLEIARRSELRFKPTTSTSPRRPGCNPGSPRTSRAKSARATRSRCRSAAGSRSAGACRRSSRPRTCIGNAWKAPAPRRVGVPGQGRRSAGRRGGCGLRAVQAG